MNAWDLVAVFLGGGIGGIAVKVLDYLHSELQSRRQASRSSRDLVNLHLDPILKAADELVGKTRSLAASDFKELGRLGSYDNPDFKSLMTYGDILFLYAQLWSKIQILRMESVYVNLGSSKDGKRLRSFFSAMESKRTRVVDRAWQRGIGESLIDQTDSSLRTMTYYEFVEEYLESKKLRDWFKPLVVTLQRIEHTRERQKLLVYGVIVHALIDTLDPKHLVSRKSPGWGNKLTKKSRRNLIYRVFKIYLPFVKNPHQYI